MTYFKLMMKVAAVCTMVGVIALSLAAQAVQQQDVIQLEEKLKYASFEEKIKLINRFFRENLEKRPGLSLQYAREALRLAEESGGPAEIAAAFKNIGSWFYVTTQYKEALEYYLNALDFESKLENKQFVANVLTNIGMVYWRLGQLKTAEGYHRQALEMRKDNGYSHREMGGTLINLGLVMHDQGRYNDALTFFRRAGVLFKKGGHKRQTAAVYNNIGTAYFKMKQYPQAHENYSQAQAIYAEIGHQWGIANSYVNFAELYNEKNETRQAQLFLDKAKKLANKYDFRDILSDIYLGNSRLYKSNGSFKEALEFHEKYLEIYKGLNEEDIVKLKGVLQTSFNDRQKDNRINLLLQRQKNERLVIYSLVIAMVLILILLVVLYSRIREHKRLENERVRAAKLDTVRLLSGGIAHDFNNLLAVISGNLELAIMESSWNDGTRTYLDQARGAASSAASLAKKFLTLSEQGFGFRENVILSTFLRETIRSTIDKSGSPVDLRLQLPGELGIVEGDVFQLRRALENLIQNALESIAYPGNGEEGGKLEVSAVVLELEHEIVASLEAGTFAAITIKDNGEGIHPENIPRIFDPYFSTREDVTRKGLGMGLAVAQAVVKGHGGAITVASQPGQGSVFTVYLPVSGYPR